MIFIRKFKRELSKENKLSLVATLIMMFEVTLK